MKLTALEHWAVEHLADPGGQRLGPVEHRQDRAGGVQAAFAQVNEQSAYQGGVLRRAFGQRERVLGALGVDAQGDHTAVLGEVHPVDHDRHQIQRGQVGGEQLGQGGLGGLDEPPRHRRLRRRRAALLDVLADGFEPDRVVPGRQAREHPLEGHASHDLGAGELLVAGHRQLSGAIRGAHPRSRDRHPPAPEAGRAGLVAPPGRSAVWVVASLRAAHRGDVVLHQRLHDLQPGADRDREQALARRGGDVIQRDLHPPPVSDPIAVPQRGLAAARAGLPTLAHGGPFPTESAPEVPTPRQAPGRGPPPQLPRTSGQPPTPAPSP